MTPKTPTNRQHKTPATTNTPSSRRMAEQDGKGESQGTREECRRKRITNQIQIQNNKITTKQTKTNDKKRKTETDKNRDHNNKTPHKIKETTHPTNQDATDTYTEYLT